MKKKKNRFPKKTALLLGAAALLLLGSTVGSTRAALTYYSENYVAGVEMSSIGITLLENDKTVGARNYDKNGEWMVEKEERELEPRFIEALTGIYEHIFKVDLSDYHELVTTLLCNTMQKIEGCRNLLIHVSGNDYENVKENKERLQKEAGGSTVSVEIAEDKTLSAGQAMIETENGVYDCSLDTELSELTRKLKLLSYEALK